MDENSLKKIIEQGETATVEFKSWAKAASMRERINLVVPELIAFANYKGGRDVNVRQIAILGRLNRLLRFCNRSLLSLYSFAIFVCQSKHLL